MASECKKPQSKRDIFAQLFYFLPRRYVFWCTIVLPSFLVWDVSVSVSSIYCCLLVCILSCGRRHPSIFWVIGRSSHRLRARWLTYFVRWRLAFLMLRLDAAFDELREWWLFFPVAYIFWRMVAYDHLLTSGFPHCCHCSRMCGSRSAGVSPLCARHKYTLTTRVRLSHRPC